MKRLARGLAAGLAGLALSACSGLPQLAYNNVDRLVRLELGDYVELDAAQQRAFDAEFAALWRWHRREALPAYAADLEALAAVLTSGRPQRADIDRTADAVLAHGQALRGDALPRLARLMPLLSDAQAAGILQERREQLFERLDEHAGESVAQRQRRLLDEVTDEVDDWTGPLAAAQRGIIAAHLAAAEARGELDTDAQRQSAERRLASLQALLDARSTGDLEARLLAAAEPRDADAAAEWAARRERFRDTTTRLAATLEPAQRARLAKRLLALAADCRRLAADAQPP